MVIWMLTFFLAPYLWLFICCSVQLHQYDPDNVGSYFILMKLINCRAPGSLSSAIADDKGLFSELADHDPDLQPRSSHLLLPRNVPIPYSGSRQTDWHRQREGWKRKSSYEENKPILWWLAKAFVGTVKHSRVAVIAWIEWSLAEVCKYGILWISPTHHFSLLPSMHRRFL